MSAWREETLSSAKNHGHDIIVLGASAGGVLALSDVIGSLPADLPAAVFAVLHVSPHATSALPRILSRAGDLTAVHPKNGKEEIRPGQVYIAPPDRHLAIENGHVKTTREASENGHRPAVDVLFRTAARYYGPRVVGVVLTGNLDDGTAGLADIKERGGVAVVQDPDDADHPGMPTSAILHVPVDHVVPIAEIGNLLDHLAREPVSPEALAVFQEAFRMSTREEKKQDLDGERGGVPSAFTCPDCGGSLFEKLGQEPLHFRCRTGHAYSPETLGAKQADTLETALWAALRSLEEQAALSRRMEKRFGDVGGRSGKRYGDRALETEKHADLLREMLQKGVLEVE
jgi:two-component system chemotaxis response regulator CheB